MNDKTKGVKTNYESKHCIRFADDIVIVIDLEKEINKMLHIFSYNLKQTESGNRKWMRRQGSNGSKEEFVRDHLYV